MPTYEKADKVLQYEVHDALARFRPDLAEAEVTVGVLLAHAARDKNGEPKGPALKHRGIPAAAVIRIVSYKQRVKGEPDLELVIDGDQWPEFSDERKEALLHHEALHAELRRDQEGGIILDDCNRPKLKLRLHDLDLGVFYSIAQKYPDSIDAKLLGEAARVVRQLELDFPTDETPASDLVLV